MNKRASKRRVVMARRVAEAWLRTRVHPEHRLTVYYGARDIRNVPSLLRSFRDGKLRVGSIDPISDLGIQEEFDHLVLWSSNREGLRQLQAWFEERGCETTGVW